MSGLRFELPPKPFHPKDNVSLFSSTRLWMLLTFLLVVTIGLMIYYWTSEEVPVAAAAVPVPVTVVEPVVVKSWRSSYGQGRLEVEEVDDSRIDLIITFTLYSDRWRADLLYRLCVSTDMHAHIGEVKNIPTNFHVPQVTSAGNTISLAGALTSTTDCTAVDTQCYAVVRFPVRTSVPGVWEPFSIRFAMTPDCIVPGCIWTRGQDLWLPRFSVSYE
jgi:hypothetical protein